jgi:hypothetical protein
LTTDGHRMYLTAVPDAFGNRIDFAQLHKDLWQRSRRTDSLQPRAMSWRQARGSHRQPG